MKRDVFQAIADPTRRAILVLVAAQAMTPNAMAAHFNLTRQAVSKHIKILTETQLLKQEKSGREIFYHINPTRMQEIDQWIAVFKGLLEKQFSQLDSILINLNQKQ